MVTGSERLTNDEATRLSVSFRPIPMHPDLGRVFVTHWASHNAARNIPADHPVDGMLKYSSTLVGIIVAAKRHIQQPSTACLPSCHGPFTRRYFVLLTLLTVDGQPEYSFSSKANSARRST
jgi:hypothetical protein